MLEGLKGIAGLAIQFSTQLAVPVLAALRVLVAFAAIALSRLERDFLPPFNEGAVQVNALLAPGTSLATSNQIGVAIQEELMKIDSVKSVARRTGRAELDEHAEGVNVTEMFLEIADDANRERRSKRFAKRWRLSRRGVEYRATTRAPDQPHDFGQ